MAADKSNRMSSVPPCVSVARTLLPRLGYPVYQDSVATFGLSNLPRLCCHVWVVRVTKTLLPRLACPSYQDSVATFGLSKLPRLCCHVWDVQVTKTLLPRLACPSYQDSVATFGLSNLPGLCCHVWVVQFTRTLLPHLGCLSYQNSVATFGLSNLPGLCCHVCPSLTGVAQQVWLKTVILQNNSHFTLFLYCSQSVYILLWNSQHKLCKRYESNTMKFSGRCAWMSALKRGDKSAARHVYSVGLLSGIVDVERYPQLYS